jgi:hypothetical protein
LGAWYSQKAAKPVVGFLGPNALKGLRVEIDYAKGAVSAATLGTVVDALGGKPGDVRVLVLDRQGKRIRVEARVHRFM